MYLMNADLKRGFDERITINAEYDYHYRTTGEERVTSSTLSVPPRMARRL